ncbi:MAG TPA: helix-turn-helix transcriptional regulator [Candidatus Dormibacteraeota bacterium]|nr:helix-turn-helix transcriptional regulator [Candidatus Dormibacteraeota bacterium]
MTSEVRSDRPAQITVGLLRPCLLAHLIGASAYGYELHQRLLSIGLECDLGTVYRCLNAMEEEGLLRSTWERSSGGRSRRRYELSATGVRMVDSYVTTVEQLVAVAEAFLEMRRDGATEEGAILGRPARGERERPHIAVAAARSTA